LGFAVSAMSLLPLSPTDGAGLYERNGPVRDRVAMGEPQ
jgi:hypothetical protein